MADISQRDTVDLLNHIIQTDLNILSLGLKTRNSTLDLNNHSDLCPQKFKKSNVTPVHFFIFVVPYFIYYLRNKLFGRIYEFIQY